MINKPSKGKTEKKKNEGNNATSKTLSEKILFYFKEGKFKDFSEKKLIKKFNKHYSKEDILSTYENLKAAQKIAINTKKATAQKPSIALGSKVFEAKVDMTKNGAAYLISEDFESDIYVSRRDINHAFDGDKVKFQIIKTSPSGKIEGRIVEVVERAQEFYVCTIHQSPRFAFAVPDKENMSIDFYVPLEKLNGAADGDKVIIKMTDWPYKFKNPIGEVVETMGKAGSHDVEMKSILIENGFQLEFSPEALRELHSLPEKITETDIANRRDLRGLTTFTIDPEDAKDFDDALSYLPLENGNVEIGVHIADVSHYIQPETALDKEAYKRATSVYLVDRVLPMLPEKISNFLCSLRPNEDKLCFSVIFEINHKAEVKEVWYGRTVIHSQKRFTYQDAQDILDGAESEFSEALHHLFKLSKIIRNKRMDDGAIAFESTEVRFRLDAAGKPIEVYTKPVIDTNKLIEEYMLLANKYVAMYVSKLKIKKQNVPGVYRIHDAPNITKLTDFAEFAKRFGYKLKFEAPEQSAATINDLLKKIRGRKEQNVLEQLMVRSMAKAAYDTNNIGHFGLAFPFYSHFTSPIRRYPDVLTHRILQACIDQDAPPYEKNILQEMCLHVSAKERAAMSAERESTKYKQVEFLSEKIGESFDGLISGVIGRGLFVELIENKCEGFLPAEKISYGEVVYSDSSFTLTDSISGIKYTLGDEIKVKVIAADLERRRVEFALDIVLPDEL